MARTHSHTLLPLTLAALALLPVPLSLVAAPAEETTTALPAAATSPHPALSALAALLSHDSPEVRLAAAESLAALENAALPVLGDVAQARAEIPALCERISAGDAPSPQAALLCAAHERLTQLLTKLAEPPRDAVRLFDGTSLSHWQREGGGDIQWTVVDGSLRITPGSGSIITRLPVSDFHLYLEFNIPQSPAHIQGQQRGNSGVYIQQRYEIQVLDSFGLEAGPSDCGAIYGFKAPDRNASRPPGEWQSYHIRFRQPRWEQVDGEWHKRADARLTVVHNGHLIHNDVAVPNKTGAGLPEGPQSRPLRLQDHGSAVRFRDIWLVPLDGRAPDQPVQLDGSDLARGERGAAEGVTP